MTGNVGRIALFAAFGGIAALCVVVICTYLICKSMSASRTRKLLPATRIKIRGSPLDAEANIKLIHQQPRLGGSGTAIAEMNPLMRNRPLRDSSELVRCKSSPSQHHLASPSTKTLMRPMSQSVQYLAPRPSSSLTMGQQQTSLTNLQVGSGYVSQNIDIAHSQRVVPQVELTLVYVSSSGQLLVHLHRLSNVPTVRYGKEYTTYVKVVLDGRVRRSYRSALVGKSQQRCAQVFKFPGVTARDLADGRLTTTVYLERGRWRSGKKLGSWRIRLDEIALADGVPRSLTGLLAASHPAGPKDDGQLERDRRMASAAELGQLLVSLQHQPYNAAGPSRIKILIRRAEGLPSAKTMFEPEYIVVVNAFYPDGTSETKETIPSRGKVPVWNHLIEFDVTDRPIESCWLNLVLLRKSKKGHSPDALIGHLTLGANSTPGGERHWQAIVTPHDIEITQWHRLTSR